jgi:hypothetical protein
MAATERKWVGAKGMADVRWVDEQRARGIHASISPEPGHVPAEVQRCRARKNLVCVAVGRHSLACKNGDQTQIEEAKRVISEAQTQVAIEEALGAEFPPSSEGHARLAALLTGGEAK